MLRHCFHAVLGKMGGSLKKRSSKLLRIVYANWPEGYVNQRFIDALVQKYSVVIFFFDETGTEIARMRQPAINIPSEAKIVTIKDPPLLKIPFDLRLATKRGSVGWVLKFLMRALFFRRLIGRIHADLVIGNGVSGTNPYGFCCAFSGYHPFIVLVWGSDVLIEARDSLFFRMIARFVLRKADGVIVDSEIKTRAVVELGCQKSKIRSFPWGIDLELFGTHVEGTSVRKQLGWERNKIVISTRNHVAIYGIEYLIRAIPAVVKAVPEARFMIMGEGPSTELLKKMTEALGITGYTRFMGRVPNHHLSRYLRAADVYVSTSLSDGASVSLLESMACGLPAVVSDIPGNREWVQNGKNGFLVPVENSKVLAEKLIVLLKNDKTRESAGIANLELAKTKANWKQNANRLYNIVEELVTR
jgi:glycosyltransferase involved in cell wall biosynthesis